MGLEYTRYWADELKGKQIVYHSIQDPNDAAGSEDIVAMDQEITRLRDEIAMAKGQEKILKANLVTLNATMSTKDIQTALLVQVAEKKEILARLGPLRSGNVKPVSLEEKTAVAEAWTMWSRRANMRKKICMEVWAHITEEMPEGKTKEELWVRMNRKPLRHLLTVRPGRAWFRG